MTVGDHAICNKDDNEEDGKGSNKRDVKPEMDDDKWWITIYLEANKIRR